VNARVLAVGLLLLAGCSITPFQRGLLYYEQGRYARALTAFDEAVRTKPTAEAYANRGSTRARLQDTRGAIDDFTQALVLQPDDVEVLVNRGNAYVISRDFAAAIADFSQVLHFQPAFAGVWFNRGLARSQAGDVAGARADWDQAIALTKDPEVQAALERRAEALTRGAGAPAPDTGAGSALARRALDRELAGDHKGAVADLKSALALERDPDRRAALEDLLKLWEDAQ